jgi:hypothetical protein
MEAVRGGPNDTTADADHFQPMRLASHVEALRRTLAVTQKESPLAITSHSPRSAIGSGSTRNQISRCAPTSLSPRATPRSYYCAPRKRLARDQPKPRDSSGLVVPVEARAGRSSESGYRRRL